MFILVGIFFIALIGAIMFFFAGMIIETIVLGSITVYFLGSIIISLILKQDKLLKYLIFGGKIPKII